MIGAVEAYTILKTVHVLAAVLWVGGGITVNILGTRVVRSREGTAMARFGRETEWIGTHVFTPAALLVLLFGVFTVINGHIGFGHGWVLFGIAGIVFTALTGSLFLGPQAKKLAALVESRGPDDPEVVERLRRLLMISRLDLTVLILVVVDMVLKPGG